MSLERYDDLVMAWLRKQEGARYRLTIDELVLLYLDFARGYYLKDGKPTSEIHDIRAAVRPLIAQCGISRTRDFGPAKLKAVRDEMVKLGWARKSINKQVHRINRMIRWAVENEHVPADILAAVRAVAALKKGKTAARETKPIQPVDDGVVNRTLPHLTLVVADMVRLQRLTGMRPAEVCIVRPCDVDRSGDVWKYQPSTHKNEHHDIERVIFIGPQGQNVLRPYLLRAAELFCFSPVESEAKRRQAQHEARTTPNSCGNRPGSNRKPQPDWEPSDHYTTATYRRAIERACDKAFPIPSEYRVPRNVRLPEREVQRIHDAADAWRKSQRWAPNRLRHSAATTIRKQFGLEAAQVTLGHAGADVTQIYAERDMQKASDVMRVVGCNARRRIEFGLSGWGLITPADFRRLCGTTRERWKSPDLLKGGASWKL